MSTDLTLYGLTEELSALDEILVQDYGEITDEYVELLNQITPLLERKTDGCVGYIKKEEDLIKLAKEKIASLREFIKQRENKINKFKEYVKFCLEKTGKKSFEGELHQIKLRKPSKKLVIYEEKEVPTEFITVESLVKIDTMALKKAVKNGEVNTPGIRLEDGATSVLFQLKKGKENE